MTDAKISINQLVEFYDSTEKMKRRIISQQKSPNKLLIPWYQKAKGAIRSYFRDINDFHIINNAIDVLRNRVPLNNRQKIDRDVSIEALLTVKEIKIPRILKTVKYEIVTLEKRSFVIRNVNVIVAPEVIIRATINGKIFYGGIKLHISKGKPFNLNQAKFVAVTLNKYLSKNIVESGASVASELCFCFDVFAGRMVPAPPSNYKEVLILKKACVEVNELWGNI